MNEEEISAQALATEIEQAELGARLAEMAAQNDIPLGADHALTGRLAKVPSADQIPEQVYGAVAAVLSFLRDVENQSDD